MTTFPNKAGTHADTDAVLAAELTAARIPYETIERMRRSKSEVPTAIFGELHQWSFERAWYYWVAAGPGIPIEDAEVLHESFGTSVRVGGHCGCPSPREYYGGFGVGLYHVDTQEGLNALAETIRRVASREPRKNLVSKWKQIAADRPSASPIICEVVSDLMRL